MTVTIPKHKDWVAFKKTYGIPPHAVSGIDMGKELDTYHDKLSHDFKKNAANAAALEAKFAKYLKGISESKVAKGKFNSFKTDFTNHYLLMANRAAEEFSAMGGDLAAYTERLRLVIRDGAKLKPGAAVGVLQAYRQGPVRGLLAAGTKVRGFDPKDITKLWGPIDGLINKLDVHTGQQTIDKLVQLITATIPKTKQVAAKNNLTL